MPTRVPGRNRRALPRALLAAVVLPAAVSWPAAVAAGTSSLWVETAEPGSQIWVDERFAGMAPVLVDSLEPGQREVQVGLPAESAIWVHPWKTTTQLLPGRTDTLVVGPLVVLHLQTTPSAAVRSRDRDLGWTPMSLLLPADAETRLEIAAPRYEPRALDVRLRGARDSTLILALDPIPSRNGRKLSSGTPTWERRARVILPVGAVLLGIVGAWSRMTADRAYEGYEITLDRQEMESKLDRARRYDNLAVGFWIGAEACLVSAAWLWLRGGADPPLSATVDPDGTTRVGIRLDLGDDREAPSGREGGAP